MIHLASAKCIKSLCPEVLRHRGPIITDLSKVVRERDSLGGLRSAPSHKAVSGGPTGRDLNVGISECSAAFSEFVDVWG